MDLNGWIARTVFVSLAILFPVRASVAVDSIVTVAKAGSGSGVVGASSGAIDCGPICAGSYTDGTPLTLTATPAQGSQFTGWLGPCTGAAACGFTVGGATTVVATFAPAAIGPPRLDVDGTATSDPLTDGPLILRFLFGVTGNQLTLDVLGAGGTRNTPAKVASYLTDIRPALDIDGDGQVDPLTDGLLIVRYLFGLRGASLIAGAVAGAASRTSAPDIEAQLATFFTSVVVDPPLFSGSFTAPERSDLAALPLPQMPGRPGLVLVGVPHGFLYFDPAERTPVSAASECAVAVLSCYQPGVRDWAGCLANVPQCGDDTPWIGEHPMCCAAGCAGRYQALRLAGEVPPAAFVKAVFRAPSCMPGITGYVPPEGSQ
jgi:hypothetical protein